jgi:Transmembrane secretion effector
VSDRDPAADGPHESNALSPGPSRQDGPPATNAPTPLSKNRNFRLVWIGQVLSGLGTEFGYLAYPLLILALTRSAVLAGAVATVTSVVAFVVRLPAGALADRWDRRATMIVTDLVRTVVLAALAVLVATDHVTWEEVLAVATLDRVGDTLFTPASSATLAAIVDDSQLESAWAASEGRQYGASLVGPALGGVLYGIARAVPFVGDAVSYGVSVLTSSALRGRFRPARVNETRPSIWREAAEGVRFTLAHPLLRAVVVQAPLINFAINGALFTVILGLRLHGTAPGIIGGATAIAMSGGLLGAVLAPRLQPHLTITRAVNILTLGGTLVLVVAALVMPSPLVAIPLALPLVVAPATNAILFAAMFRATPEELRGRVTNTLMQLTTALAALAPLVAGLVTEELSAAWALGVFAGAMAISAVLARRLGALGDLEAEGATGP